MPADAASGFLHDTFTGSIVAAAIGVRVPTFHAWRSRHGLLGGTVRHDRAARCDLSFGEACTAALVAHLTAHAFPAADAIKVTADLAFAMCALARGDADAPDVLIIHRCGEDLITELTTQRDLASWPGAVFTVVDLRAVLHDLLVSLRAAQQGAFP